MMKFCSWTKKVCVFDQCGNLERDFTCEYQFDYGPPAAFEEKLYENVNLYKPTPPFSARDGCAQVSHNRNKKECLGVEQDA